MSLHQVRKQGSSHLINIRRETADVTVCIKPFIDFVTLSSNLMTIPCSVSLGRIGLVRFLSPRRIYFSDQSRKQRLMNDTIHILI